MTTYTLPLCDPYDDWAQSNVRGFVPNDRQRLAMDSVARALAAGMYYNDEVRTFCAKDLGISTEIDSCMRIKVQGGTFGYDLYYARDALDAAKRWKAVEAAAESLKLRPGLDLGTLVFSDFKASRKVTITGVADDGLSCAFTCSRGPAKFSGRADALGLRVAMERAKDRGLRKAL